MAVIMIVLFKVEIHLEFRNVSFTLNEQTTHTCKILYFHFHEWKVNLVLTFAQKYVNHTEVVVFEPQQFNQNQPSFYVPGQPISLV